MHLPIDNCDIPQTSMNLNVSKYLALKIEGKKTTYCLYELLFSAGTVYVIFSPDTLSQFYPESSLRLPAESGFYSNTFFTYLFTGFSGIFAENSVFYHGYIQFIMSHNLYSDSWSSNYQTAYEYFLQFFHIAMKYQQLNFLKKYLTYLSLFYTS